MRFPWSFFFSRLKNSSCLSLSASEKCSIPLIILITVLCIHPNRSMCWGLHTWTQYSRWGVSRGQSRGGESPPSACWPLLFWCRPGCCFSFGLQVHTAGSHTDFHPWNPPSPLQGCQWVPLLHSYLYRCNPHICTCWSELVELGSHLRSLWIASHPSYCVTALLSLSVTCKLADAALYLPVWGTGKDIREHQSQGRALRGSTGHQPPHGHKANNHNSLAISIQPTPYSPDTPPSKSMSLQFEDKDVVWDHAEGLREV